MSVAVFNCKYLYTVHYIYFGCSYFSFIQASSVRINVTKIKIMHGIKVMHLSFYLKI